MSSTLSPQPREHQSAYSQAENSLVSGKSIQLLPAGFVVLLTANFIWFYLQPLWHTDLWGHLAYGRVIWESGQIPKTEPLMPFSTGVSFGETAWLSKVAGYLAITIGGTTALHLLYAAGISTCIGLLMLCVYRQTRSGIAAMIAAAVFLSVNWQQLLIIRPQLAGLVGYVVLFVLLTKRQWTWLTWLLVPAVFTCWANLHGSFVAGLVLIAGFAVGAVIESVLKQKSLAAPFLDDLSKRYCLSGLLAVLAVLLNPYGLAIFNNVWQISIHPNLQDLVEWQPLTLRLKQGRAAAIVVSLLIVSIYFSRKRISITQLILLFGWGAAAMWTSRMIIWWAPILAYSVALQLQAWGQEHSELISTPWRDRWRYLTAKLYQPRRAQWWLCMGLMLAVLFWMRSPTGFAFPDQTDTQCERGFSAQTPIGMAEFFMQHPPTGIVLNTYEYGDYLLWAGPPEMQLFVASHAHLAPRRLWQDYLAVTRLRPGWSRILDQYRIGHVALNKYKHRGLTLQLSRQEDWRQVFEDDWGVVFQRVAETK